MKKPGINVRAFYLISRSLLFAALKIGDTLFEGARIGLFGFSTCARLVGGSESLIFSSHLEQNIGPCRQVAVSFLGRDRLFDDLKGVRQKLHPFVGELVVNRITANAVSNAPVIR